MAAGTDCLQDTSLIDMGAAICLPTSITLVAMCCYARCVLCHMLVTDRISVCPGPGVPGKVLDAAHCLLSGLGTAPCGDFTHWNPYTSKKPQLTEDCRESSTVMRASLGSQEGSAPDLFPEPELSEKSQPWRKAKGIESHCHSRRARGRAVEMGNSDEVTVLWAEDSVFGIGQE